MIPISLKKRMWYIHCVPKLKPWNHQFVSRCAPLIALYPVKPYARFERILPKCSREEGEKSKSMPYLPSLELLAQVS